jgi:threonine/homoserine/homoserine lactone efflux protein
MTRASARRRPKRGGLEAHGRTQAMRELVAFLAVSALVIVTPGQDTALTIRNTLLGGRVAGVFTAIGVSAGQATWTVATAAGVGALLVASEPAFVALKLVGSAYLVFLGLQALFGRTPLHVERSGPRVTARGALRQGLFSNLANPKMLAFFTSLLPQFASSFAGLLALGLTFCTMTLIWLSLYSVVVTKAGSVLRRAGVRRAIEAVTGTVLIALGLRLATEQR